MRPLGTSAKLFLAILAACAVILTINGIASRISFERDFMGYLNDQGKARMVEVLPRIEAAYRQHGNWDFVRERPEAWFELMRPRQPFNGDAFVPSVSDQTGAVPRFALLDSNGKILIGNPNAGSRDDIRMPVTVDGMQAGWLAMVPFQKAIAAGDVRFYQAQLRSWWLNGLASVAVAALLAWVLSRAMLGRIRILAGVIHKLAGGNYSARVDRASDDELGRLAVSLNQLADALDSTERNRRNFMADISHELRTPLAVLRAELEAIQDGIRPMSASTLEPLQGQVHQLGKLIDDLYELSVTQAGEMSYRFSTIDLDSVLQTTLAGMRGRFLDAGLTLETEPVKVAALIHGDERRLLQLFANLLENALRYTNSGGHVVARVECEGAQVRAIIENSAPGIEPSNRERLFERFYRVEASRNRASGGSGLGLAICRNIVEAHSGTIGAEDSALGGLRIVSTFPANAQP